MEDRRSRSDQLRARAERYRALAKLADPEFWRDAYLEVARGWDDLADREAHVEERERHAGDGNPSAEASPPRANDSAGASG